jgi:hypothetical protein
MLKLGGGWGVKLKWGKLKAEVIVVRGGASRSS